MVYWNCDVKNKRCTHFLPLVAAIIWFWQSKFPVEMRLWVPVLAWYLRTLLNVVSEQLRWAKSSNMLERLHICSCDAAAHWHSSSSESERSLERVSSFESVRSTQCCKKGGCYVPPHACSLPTMSNLSRSPKNISLRWEKKFAEAKFTPPLLAGLWQIGACLFWLSERIHANIMGQYNNRLERSSSQHHH